MLDWKRFARGPLPWIAIGVSVVAGVAFINGGVGNVGDVFLALAVLFVGLFLYFVPTMVAASRDPDRSGGVLICNVIFGWTVIGWFLVLAWAFSIKRASIPARTNAAAAAAIPAAPPAEAAPAPRPLEEVERDESGRIVIE